MFVQDDQWFPVWLWVPSRKFSFSVVNGGYQFISFSRGCALLEGQRVSTPNSGSSIMIFIQWGLINSPYENILQCIGFLQEVLVVVPLRHGPAEHLGRSWVWEEWARVLRYSQSTQLLVQLWDLWDRISADQNLTWEAQSHFSSSQGTKASSWSWVVRWGWWDRTQYSCFFCCHWPAMCWLAFIPRAMLIPKCPLCFCNPSLGSDPHCGLTEGGDFWQLLVVGNEKRFSSMMFLMLMGISTPLEACIPSSFLPTHPP